MKITNVQVFPIKNLEGKLKAYAKIEIEDCLMLSHIRIFEGVNGLFVAFPVEYNKGNEYNHIFYPVTKKFKEEIQTAVLDEYSKILNEE